MVQLLRELAAAVREKETYVEEVGLNVQTDKRTITLIILWFVYCSYSLMMIIYVFIQLKPGQFSFIHLFLHLAQACKLGVVQVLTRLLKKKSSEDNDQIFDLISSIVSSCSGPMATGTRLREVKYEGIGVFVKEGALGDGVGARVWAVAHTICQALASNPVVVRNRSVLELGAGCGVCGLLAAKLGAQDVVISDYVDQLLLNLRDSMHINMDSKCIRSSEMGRDAQQSDGSSDWKEEVITTWDPEDGEEVDADECIMDMFNAQEDAPNQLQQLNENKSWEAGNIAIRFADWEDSVAYIHHRAASSLQKQDLKEPSQPSDVSEIQNVTGSYCALDGASTRSIAPEIERDRQFDVILGTDVLYEWPMARSFPAAVHHRLRPGGVAIVCCAVRDQAMFDDMIQNMIELRFRVELYEISPLAEDGGTLSMQHEYEGGYRLIVAEDDGISSGFVDLSGLKRTLKCSANLL